MPQEHDESDAPSPRVPPATFHLMAHPFQPTGEYQPVAGLLDRVQALEQTGRYASALNEIFTVLDSQPAHPQALMLAMILLGESRTNRRRAAEPLSQAALLDTRLDPIYAVCSHCQTREWVPEAIAALPYAEVLANDPVGLQCYQCGYVVCRECLHALPSGPGLSVAAPTCPNCRQGTLRSPVFPTGRRPHQMRRHPTSVAHVLILREGPVPPDDVAIQHLLAMVSPDILGNRGAKITAFPVSSWSDEIDALADALVVRMEADGEFPAGSFEKLERAHVQDEDGIRSLVVKVMQTEERYDLARLGLPREGRSFEQTLAREIGTAGAVGLLSYQSLAAGQQVNSPVVRALHGRAFVILRLDMLSPGELAHMREATGQSRVLLVPVLALCPTHPVLGLKFVIYDDLANPYSVEGPRGIQDATVQDFLQAMLHDGGGDFYLYAGPDAEPLGSGHFALRMPPFSGPGFPYHTRSADLQHFWLLLGRAAQHLASIAPAARDFSAAVRFYLEHTS